jgi:predicted CoA-binding protein
MTAQTKTTKTAKATKTIKTVTLASKNTDDWYKVKYINENIQFITCKSTKEARAIATGSKVHQVLSEIATKKIGNSASIPSTEGNAYRVKAILTGFKNIIEQSSYKGILTIPEAIKMVNTAYKTGDLTEIFLAVSEDNIILDMAKDIRRMM